MSGGSFNYVCFKEKPDFVDGQGLSDLKDMVELMELHWPGTAATVDSRKYYNQAYDDWKRNQEGDPHLIELQKVWREIEWWCSNDSSASSAAKAVSDYAFPADKKGLISWVPRDDQSTPTIEE